MDSKFYLCLLLLVLGSITVQASNSNLPNGVLEHPRMLLESHFIFGFNTFGRASFMFVRLCLGNVFFFSYKRTNIVYSFYSA